MTTTPILTPLGIVIRIETRDTLSTQNLPRRFMRTAAQHAVKTLLRRGQDADELLDESAG